MSKLIGEISSVTSINFKVDVFGVYSISITAQCEQENDLKILIDDNDGRYYQFSSFIPNDPNFKLLIDPLAKNNDRIEQSWFRAYEVATIVISGSVKDPTEGATYFHSSDISQKRFTTHDVPGAIYLKKIGDFLFYQDPNEQK